MNTLKIITALTLAATAAAPLAAVAQEVKPVMSKVTAATVFLQGAEVTSTATLALVKGASEVSIEGLSPDIDRASIRVNIGGGVVVSAHEFSIDYLSSAGGQAGTPRLRMLRDSINIYSARLEKTEADIEINTAMQGYLASGITKNVSGSETGLGIDELRRTMDYYQSKSEEILTASREMNRLRDELSGALARVRNQFREESGLGGRTSGVLRLSLTAPAAGTYTATVTCFTSGAGWSPYYDINAASTDRPVTISSRSRVSQTTGLDWENVRLTLSTATPSNGRVAPLFSTWFLRERQRPMPLSKAAGMQNSYSYDAVAEEEVVDDMVVIAYGRAERNETTGAVAAAPMPPPPPPPTIYDHVTSSTGALDVVYNIDLPYTIPGNGKEQTIDLATAQTPAEYKYYCAPRLDGATYLIAEIAEPEKLGLLSAPAGITYDGTWIGDTWIDAASTEEKLTVTLGTDKRVSVTRELAREFSSTRATGNTTEQTFTWRITVRNNQTRPVNMILKDQYPTSTDRNVTVTVDTRATTPWSTNVAQTGVVTWEGELAPGEVRVHTLSYTVKYPRSMSLDL